MVPDAEAVVFPVEVNGGFPVAGRVRGRSEAAVTRSGAIARTPGAVRYPDGGTPAGVTFAVNSLHNS
jgi:hypothetical protein